MKNKDISQAKDPDVRGSVAAIRRAAQLARQIAIQTGTNLIIESNGKIVRLSADDLMRADLGNTGVPADPDTNADEDVSVPRGDAPGKS